jgi:hypothetical protein
MCYPEHIKLSQYARQDGISYHATLAAKGKPGSEQCN